MNPDDTPPITAQTTPPPAPALPENAESPNYWDNVKDFGLAALSAATGDPEAMKTLVEVLANATHMGLEQVKLDEDKDQIKVKLENALDNGADGVIKALTWYQKQASGSNQKLRQRFGRKYRASSPKPQ